MDRDNHELQKSKQNLDSKNGLIDKYDMREYDLQKIIDIINKKNIDLKNGYTQLFLAKFDRLMKKRNNDGTGLKGLDLAYKKLESVGYVLKQKKNEEQKITNETKEKKSKLSNDVKITNKKEKKYEVTKTKELNASISNTFDGDTSRIDYIQGLSAQTRGSLGNILRRSDLKKVLSDLQKALPDPNDKGEVELTPFNNKNITKALRDLGYKFDSFWESPEAIAIYSTIEDYVRTQDNMKNISSKDKLALLLDFDKNGKLETDVNFNVGEAQQYYLVLKGLTSKGMDTFMKNLGFVSMDEFGKDMGQNLFSAREKFQRKLGSYIEWGVKPSELIVQGGLKKALDKKYEDIPQEIKNKIGEEIDNNKSLDNKLSTLKDAALIKGVKDKIKMEAVRIGVGSVKGVGANFDIKRFVNGYVDSLQVGMINGIPGIAFTKKIFEERLKGTGLKLSASLANFYIPIFSGSYEKNGIRVVGGLSPVGGAAVLSYTFEGNKEVKELFSNDIKGDYEPSIYTGVSTIGSALGFSIDRVDSDTKKGIEKALKSMKGKLDIIKKDLSKGKSFEESKYYKISENKEQDKIIYNELKKDYDSFKNEKYAEKALDDMMKGYLNYYENDLYKNAKGLKLSQVGAGLAFVSGYLPISYITMVFQDIKQKWNLVNYRLDEEESNTKRELNENEFNNAGLKVEKYKGYNVYSIPEDYDISSSKDTVQAEKGGNGRLYFVGDNVRIHEHASASGYTRIAVIDGGKKNKDGLYDLMNEKDYVKIKDSIGSVSINKNVDTGMEANDVVSIMQEIQEKVDVRNIDKKLQKSIYRMLVNGKFDSKVWGEFVKYNKEKGLDIKLNDKLTNEQKKFLLEKVFGRFMVTYNILQKNGVDVGDKGTISFMRKISMKEFDKNGRGKMGSRESFFDKEFKKWGVSSKEINSARDELLNRFEGQKKFGMKTYDNMASFVLSSLGVVPLVGKTEVAIPNSGDPFVKVESSDLKNRMVSSLPESYLRDVGRKIGESNINLIRELFNGKEINGKKLDYEVIMFKWGDCFNDAVAIRGLRLKDNKGRVVSISSTSDVYSADNSSTNYGITFTGEKEKKKHKEQEKSETQENEKSTTQEQEKSETQEDEKSTTQE
ncbi:MAG: hypothetical protein PHN31_02925, partial [Candidatus Gracilibacteria bacterium]|nr:hypothetical protein [Candidatus Gracilibacteria bacterium]